MITLFSIIWSSFDVLLLPWSLENVHNYLLFLMKICFIFRYFYFFLFWDLYDSVYFNGFYLSTAGSEVQCVLKANWRCADRRRPMPDYSMSHKLRQMPTVVTQVSDASVGAVWTGLKIFSIQYLWKLFASLLETIKWCWK